MSRTLEIPELSLVVLVGASGSGKSTFARTHFLPTEVVSSDFCRGLVSDDDNAQDATGDAFELLHYIAGKRMTRGRLTVVDATNVQPEARKPLVALLGGKAGDPAQEAGLRDVLSAAASRGLQALAPRWKSLPTDEAFGGAPEEIEDVE